MMYSTVNPFDSCHAYEFSNLTSISQPLIKLERCIEINIVSVAAHGTHTWRLRLFLCQTTFVLSRALSSIHRPCLAILIQIASFIIIQGVWFDRNNNVKCIKGQRCMLLKIILWPNFVWRYLYTDLTSYFMFYTSLQRPVFGVIYVKQICNCISINIYGKKYINVIIAKIYHSGILQNHLNFSQFCNCNKLLVFCVALVFCLIMLNMVQKLRK